MSERIIEGCGEARAGMTSVRSTMTCKSRSRRFGHAAVGAWLPVTTLAVGPVAGAGCGEREPGSPADSATRSTLSELRGRPGLGVPEDIVHRFRSASSGLVPEMGSADGHASARVVLPARPTGADHLEDSAKGAAVWATALEARDPKALVADPHPYTTGITLPARSALDDKRFQNEGQHEVRNEVDIGVRPLRARRRGGQT